MIILAWNARGLRGQLAFRNLKKLVADSSPDLLFVSETKLCSSSASVLRCTLGFKNCMFVDAVGRKGGLCLFWNNDLNVKIISYSK